VPAADPPERTRERGDHGATRRPAHATPAVPSTGTAGGTAILAATPPPDPACTARPHLRRGGASARRERSELAPGHDPQPGAAGCQEVLGPVPWMLEAAMVLELVLRNFTEAGVIAGLLAFNADIGLHQEGKAHSTLEAIRSASPRPRQCDGTAGESSSPVRYSWPTTSSSCRWVRWSPPTSRLSTGRSSSTSCFPSPGASLDRIVSPGLSAPSGCRAPPVPVYGRGGKATGSAPSSYTTRYP